MDEARDRDESEVVGDPTLGRRRFLAGGFFGALAALFARSPRAEAKTGEAMIVGSENTAETITGLTITAQPGTVQA